MCVCLPAILDRKHTRERVCACVPTTTTMTKVISGWTDGRNGAEHPERLQRRRCFVVAFLLPSPQSPWPNSLCHHWHIRQAGRRSTASLRWAPVRVFARVRVKSGTVGDQIIKTSSTPNACHRTQRTHTQSTRRKSTRVCALAGLRQCVADLTISVSPRIRASCSSGTFSH